MSNNYNQFNGRYNIPPQPGSPQPPPGGFVKNLAPLKSFADQGLSTSCQRAPLIDPYAPRRSVTTWKVNYLVSNMANQAAHLDVDLINPWGIVIFNNQLWIANGSSDSITNYDLFGNKLLGTVEIRDATSNSSYPTGIAVNCCGGFIISNGIVSKSSRFLITTVHGTVHAYNPQVDALNSYIVLNEQLTGRVSVFSGLAIANNTLYIANFFQSKVDVFDSFYNRLLGFHFIDGDSIDPIPLDYAPSNIVHIGPFLYVVYARKDPNISLHVINGPGTGYISIFNLDGSFVRRFTSRGVLNTPWALIPAPIECGFPPGSFLVSNNGDGRINVFDGNGRYVGPLLNQAGLPIVIEGIIGLAPHYTDFSEIFFTAAINQNIDGLLGSIVKDQIIQF